MTVVKKVDHGDDMKTGASVADSDDNDIDNDNGMKNYASVADSDDTDLLQLGGKEKSS